jgi:hypothetical protein
MQVEGNQRKMARSQVSARPRLPPVPPVHSRATTSLLFMLAEIFEPADAEWAECLAWEERTHTVSCRTP